MYRFKHSKDGGRRTFPPEFLRYFFLVAPHTSSSYWKVTPVWPLNQGNHYMCLRLQRPFRPGYGVDDWNRDLASPTIWPKKKKHGASLNVPVHLCGKCVGWFKSSTLDYNFIFQHSIFKYGIATAVGGHSSRALRSWSHRHTPPLSSDLVKPEKKHLSMAICWCVLLCRGLLFL
jgi:hypothetical protein